MRKAEKELTAVQRVADNLSYAKAIAQAMPDDMGYAFLLDEVQRVIQAVELPLIEPTYTQER